MIATTRFIGKERTLAMILRLPPVANLQKGVVFNIDKNPGYRAKIASCTAELCTALFQISDDVLKQLKSGPADVHRLCADQRAAADEADHAARRLRPGLRRAAENRAVAPRCGRRLAALMIGLAAVSLPAAGACPERARARRTVPTQTYKSWALDCIVPKTGEGAGKQVCFIHHEARSKTDATAITARIVVRRAGPDKKLALIVQLAAQFRSGQRASASASTPTRSIPWRSRPACRNSAMAPSR